MKISKRMAEVLATIDNRGGRLEVCIDSEFGGYWVHASILKLIKAGLVVETGREDRPGDRGPKTYITVARVAA